MTKYRFISIALLILSLSALNLRAQQESRPNERSVYEKLQKIEERQDRFQLYLDTHMSADLATYDSKVQPFGFRGRELRLDARGKINDRFSYRLMHRFNLPQDASNTVDNQAHSLDVAGLGIQLDEKWSLFLGKQCAAYGGMQFDLNPILVYEYADIFNYVPIFLTGAKLSYEPIAKQQIQLQILNTYTKNLQEVYGAGTSHHMPQFPLTYTINWNGTIAPGLTTRWSYSYISQTDLRHTQFVSLGNQFRWGAWGAYFDAMFAHINHLSAFSSPYAQENFRSYVLKCNYYLNPQWNVFAKGIYEISSTQEHGEHAAIHEKTDNYAYVGGLEYYPMSHSDLHFYATYVVRHRNQGHQMLPTQRFSIGFIYQIPMF